MPMDKSLLESHSVTVEQDKAQEKNCRPKKSTIAFLRQFARAYTVVPNLSGAAAELIPN